MPQELQGQEPKQKRVWAAPEVIDIGHVAEVVRGGGAKQTDNQVDSGDLGKPPGQDP